MCALTDITPEPRYPRKTARKKLSEAFRTISRFCRRSDKTSSTKARAGSRSDCSQLLPDESIPRIIHSKCRSSLNDGRNRHTLTLTQPVSPNSLATNTLDGNASSRVCSDGSFLQSLRSPSSMRAVYNFNIFEDETATESPFSDNYKDYDHGHDHDHRHSRHEARSASEELSAAYQELVDELRGRAESPGIENLVGKDCEGLHPHTAFGGDAKMPASSSVSVVSERSTATVERHPSKRNLTPITTISSVLHDFDKALSAPSDSGSAETSPLSMRCGNALAEDAPPRGNNHYLSIAGDCIQKSRERSGSRARSCSSRSWDADSGAGSPESPTLSQRILSSSGTERRNLLRIKSMASFKASARAFHLGLPGVFDPASSQREVPSISPRASEAESGGSRIHRNKSTRTLRNKASFKNTLRRIKTLANLSVPYPPHSLKGKTLDELARLGGHSYFKLPHEYAPAPLQLPKCIVGTTLYLLRFGIRVPGIFQEPGNKASVAEIYNRYAMPVLKPNFKKSDTDEMIRAFDYPLESMRQAQARGDLFAHDVCTALQYFLYGLPGGIFGSHTLYKVLESINNHNFSHFGVHKDPGRGEYVPQVSGPSAAKIRLLALALVSLTDDMHLELICAIFGLLSLTVDECALRAQVHRKIHLAKEESCSQCDRLPNMGIVSRVIGGLLTDPTELVDLKEVYVFDPRTPDADRQHPGTRVAAMLIDAWKDVCLQLQSWDVFGL
ncbi:hypothetical protein KEM56_003388 [Ascosphaera pollenicola]|nr:hypothetical protein KEM56_003388 [Ascosphaera pollenicola]